MAPKPRICFVSLAAYPILAQADIPIAGGAERQQVLLGRELQKRGFEVSFVVLDHGQAAVEMRDGIKVIKSVKADVVSGRFRRVLSLVQRYLVGMVLLWRSLAKADADIYFQKMVGPSSALGVLFCWLKRRKFIYAVSAEHELAEVNTAPLPSRVLAKTTIRKASCIVAQTRHQQAMLRDTFGRNSVLIKNICPVPQEIPKAIEPPVVLWVATVRRLKRPELFFELARQIPQARFQMVGGPAADEDCSYYEDIKAQAQNLSNLEFVGFVPQHAVDSFFSRAAMLICTSESEGFSNTFLQAWGNCIPVVTLDADPDELICSLKLGLHSRSLKHLVTDVRSLLADKGLRAEMGFNGRRYVEKEHGTRAIMDQYTRLFAELVSRPKVDRTRRLN
ncbi:MAG: glycosyltransferase family 4 protein [Chloroflexi bacterium]|nr:glycosyltransferase family 4 protein [Chloroflexota bacterium]